MDRFAIVAAIWIFGLAALLSYFVYQRHPHVPDEVIYLYHARYFADGRLTVPAPAVPEAFSLYMIPYKSDRWYSIFPPGWPAVLAVGVLLGVPWLVNPFLAGVNVLLSYILVRELYDRRVARIVVLLLCVSPWHVFMSMNFMAHTFTLTCVLVAAVAITKSRRTDRAIWAWVAGVATGGVGLIRVLDGVVVVGLLGLWIIGVGGRKLKTSAIVGFVLATILVGAGNLVYNQLLLGNAILDPITTYYDTYFGPKKFALGFGPERGFGWAIDAFPGHSPLEAMINNTLNAFSLNTELFGWSTGSLMVVTLFLFSGTMRRLDFLWLAPVAVIAGAYSLFWYSGGPDFGARYWYLMLLPVIILTVRGILCLGERLESTRVVFAILSLCILALVNYVPWRAVDKYHHYLDMRPDIRYLAKEYGFGKSLVLIRGDSHPDYASAWVYNPLEPHADEPVYAWDPNPQVQTRVVQAYRDRPIWIANGPSITHSNFQVVAGPLTARQLLSENHDGR